MAFQEGHFNAGPFKLESGGTAELSVKAYDLNKNRPKVDVKLTLDFITDYVVEVNGSDSLSSVLYDDLDDVFKSIAQFVYDDKEDWNEHYSGQDFIIKVEVTPTFGVTDYWKDYVTEVLSKVVHDFFTEMIHCTDQDSDDFKRDLAYRIHSAQNRAFLYHGTTFLVGFDKGLGARLFPIYISFIEKEQVIHVSNSADVEDGYFDLDRLTLKFPMFEDAV